MLWVFGCMCMALVPKHLRHNKLSAKAIWAVHLGMAQNSKGGSTTTRQSSLVNGGEGAKDAEEEEKVQQVSERALTLPSRTTSAPRIRVTPQQRHESLHVPAAEEGGRGKRRIQAPNRLTYEALGKPAKSALAGAGMMVGDDEESEYEECAFAFFSPVEMPGEPATLKETLESSDAEEWKKAMESELKRIEENSMWGLVELLEGRKAITSKWLFKIKSNADGKIERYKSRLVAKGYQQKEKVDYKELFASMVKPTTLRALLAGGTIKGWVVKQMDVTTAFLNGVLEEEIFMAQPEGFDDCSGRVWKLKKALYGLKQAPRQWYLKLREVLEEIVFTPSSADHSLFMLGEGEQRSFMVVYVDDILIFSPSSNIVNEVMWSFKTRAGSHSQLVTLPILCSKTIVVAIVPFVRGATYSMTPRADLLTELEPSPVKHVTSALGQRAEVKGMGKAMFKGADGKMVGLKNIPLVPMPKERQVAASISTKGEAVGSGDGKNDRAKEIKSKKCNLGGTSKLGEHKESGAAAQKQHKGEENPNAAAEENYGENMRGTIASAAFSNPTSAKGECDWLTFHRQMGHVALPILQQLVKDEMVAGIRVKGEPDEVLGCPTCMQAKFTRYPFSSSEATAKAPLDEVVMDVVGPLKLGAAGAEYFLTIVDVYTRMTWVYVLSKKIDVAETVKTDWLPMVERQQDRLRANRTITESARGLLIEAGLSDCFWPDAVRSACVAKNRALTHVEADK
ncbi:unnamed protein product [Closterium sp. NIES-54]